MSKKSRDKGQRGERQFGKLFEAWWGSPFVRTPLSGGFSTKSFRDDWNASGDLVTSAEDFPFTIECKNQETWTFDEIFTAPRCKIIQWWEQTIGETTDGKIPLLVFTRNRKPNFFMMYRKDWLASRQSLKDVWVLQINGQYVVTGLLSVLTSTKKDSWVKKHEKSKKAETSDGS